MKETDRLLNKARNLRNEKPLVSIDELRRNILKTGGQDHIYKYTSNIIKRNIVMAGVIGIVIVAAFLSTFNYSPERAQSSERRVQSSERRVQSSERRAQNSELRTQNFEEGGMLADGSAKAGKGEKKNAQVTKKMDDSSKNVEVATKIGNKVDTTRLNVDIQVRFLKSFILTLRESHELTTRYMFFHGAEEASRDKEKKTFGIDIASMNYFNNIFSDINKINNEADDVVPTIEEINNVLITMLINWADVREPITNKDINSFGSQIARMLYVSQRLSEVRNTIEVLSSRENIVLADAIERLMIESVGNEVNDYLKKVNGNQNNDMANAENVGQNNITDKSSESCVNWFSDKSIKKLRDIATIINDLNFRLNRVSKYGDQFPKQLDYDSLLKYDFLRLNELKNSQELRSSKGLASVVSQLERMLEATSPDGSDSAYYSKLKIDPDKLIWNTVQGINFLELTNEELEKIGVHISDTAASFVRERIYYGMSSSRAAQLAPLGYDTTRTKPVIVKTMDIITKDFEEVGYDMPYGGWGLDDYSRLAPVCLKYLNYGGELGKSPILKDGDRAMKYIHDIQKEHMDYFYKHEVETDSRKRKEYFTKECELFDREIVIGNDIVLKRLVPVAIKLRDDSKYKYVIDKNLPNSGTSYQHLYLWFVPTEEFVSALPERYSKPLRNELDILQKYENKEVTYEQACKGLTEVETFFDLCRMQSGALEYMNVYPNPASGKASIKFLVTQPRKLNISLHDMKGNLVKIIKDNLDQQPGEYEIPLNLEGLASGMYMVAINSVEGEQIVYRFIVR